MRTYKMKTIGSVTAIGLALLLAGGSAQAMEINTESVQGDFTSTLSTGFQYSLDELEPNINSNLNGTNRANYDKNSIVSWSIKGIHELNLNFPNEWAFFGRFDWITDQRLDKTKTPLSPAAQDKVESDVRLLDLFVEKGYEIGEQYGRVRLGNQVINWGESLFFFGGINYATNPVDINRATLPGGQIKEFLLPVPMISVSQGIKEGLGFEAYYQFDWESHEFPPVGTFWSTSDFIGDGNIVTDPDILGGYEDKPSNSGQFGISVKWTPEGSETEYGFYAANYHEKFPWFGWDARQNVGDRLGIGTDNPRLFHTFAEDIQLYGVSASTDVGEWAVGGELSYRPNDVIATDPFGDCLGDALGQLGTAAARQNVCLREQKRWGFDVTAINILQPNGQLGWLLNALGGDTGFAFVEVAGFYFPDLDPVDTDALVALGEDGKFAWGLAAELDVSYEGSLIKGWTVTPGVFYRWGVSGSSQELLGWWRDGAQEANVFVNFTHSELDLTFTIQYLPFWGTPAAIVDNRDKDVLAASVFYTF